MKPDIHTPLEATMTHIDPIFAMIERHRELEVAFAAGIPEICDPAAEAASNERSNQTHRALAELVAMTPTTPAGCAALLRHIELLERDYNAALLSDYADAVSKPGRTLLSRIASVLEGQASS
jgi:hypothetical protein